MAEILRKIYQVLKVFFWGGVILALLGAALFFYYAKDFGKMGRKMRKMRSKMRSALFSPLNPLS